MLFLRRFFTHGVFAPRVARLPPGWLVRVVPQAPLRLGGAAATSAAHAGTRSSLCGVKFSFKLSPAPPCGPAVTIPRPTTTNTTPAKLSYSCVPAPSLRLCCWPGSPTWMSSWLPWAAGLPWTSSLSPNRTTLLPTRIR